MPLLLSTYLCSEVAGIICTASYLEFVCANIVELGVRFQSAARALNSDEFKHTVLKGASKAATGTVSRRSGKAARIADLHEEERKKYDDAIQSVLRLEEEKADLNEQCDAKDEQITHFQHQYEEELEKSSANATRLTEIITALEDQRVEAFELLQVYQQRIEQLSETIRKYEKDEMGGERKKTMLASIASLEELVESQKSTIQSQSSDRAALVESHKGNLVRYRMS